MSYVGRYLSINSMYLISINKFAEHPQTYKEKLIKGGYLKYFRHSKVRYTIFRAINMTTLIFKTPEK